MGGRRNVEGEEEEEEASMGVGPLARQRKFTMGERSMPSFRKSFIDVRVAIDVPLAYSSSSSSMYKMLHLDIYCMWKVQIVTAFTYSLSLVLVCLAFSVWILEGLVVPCFTGRLCFTKSLVLYDFQACSFTKCVH